MSRLILNFLLLLSFVCSFSLSAQTTDTIYLIKRRLIGIEAGSDGFFATVPDYNFIRGDLLPYYYSNVSGSLRGSLFRYYFGIKTEFKNKTNKCSFLTGLRYTRMYSAIGKEPDGGNSSEFFYFLNTQSELETEYLRVKEINRTLDYIGIPVEFKYIFSSSKNRKFYLKSGFEFDYLIQSKSEVIFYNSQMNQYSDAVISKFDDPESFFASFYLTAGLNFGKVPNVNCEIIFPYINMNPNMSKLVKSNSGIGFRFEVKLPY